MSLSTKGSTLSLKYRLSSIGIPQWGELCRPGQNHQLARCEVTWHLIPCYGVLVVDSNNVAVMSDGIMGGFDGDGSCEGGDIDDGVGGDALVCRFAPGQCADNPTYTQLIIKAAFCDKYNLIRIPLYLDLGAQNEGS